MKSIYKLLSIVAATPLVCFCQSRIDEPVEKPKEMVSIEASIPQTKVSLTAADDPALTLAWEEDDKFVVSGDSNSSEFSVSQIVNEHRAIFTGEVVSGTSFNVYYPDADVVSRSYEGQVQDGDGSTAHLAFNAVAENLDDYSDFSFTKVNGAVKLVVKVPASVTEISSISITAQNSEGTENPVFYVTNDAAGEKTATLTLYFSKGTSATDGILTAYEMVSWNPVELSSGSRLAINLTAFGRTCSYVKTIRLNSSVTISGGETFILDLSGATELKHKIAGTGTENDPYLLYDCEDLMLMEDLISADSMTYFSLEDDIDMISIDNWPALNPEPFSKGIDFEGNNHTISNFTSNRSGGNYGGFIGVLYGSVRNLTFKNPSVSASKALGVVCGYAGTGSYPATISNVKVINGTVTQNGSAFTGLIFGTNGVAGTYTDCHGSGTVTISSSAAIEKSKAASGGIAGSATGSTFEKCSFSGTINGARLSGGLVGYVRDSGTSISECWTDASVTITKINSIAPEFGGGLVGYLQAGTVSNCYSKGSVTIGTQVCGGIIGEIVNESTVSNCWSSAKLKAARCAGGIIGRACANSWNTGSAKTVNLSNCVYWGSKIDVAAATDQQGSSGSIVGYTGLKNVLADCWRIADGSFNFVNTGNTVNKPVDQDNCTGSNWTLSANTTVGAALQRGTGADPQQYLFPYWGKASSYSTVSATVSGKSLGWSTSIWDLSGDYPELINNPSTSCDDDPVVDPDDQPIMDSRTPVRPSGTGWTKTVIADGLDMYSFVGTDAYLHKSQSVYIADVDLSKYELKFSYDGNRHLTSDVMKMHDGALVAMNGAYETSSVFIKTDWSVKFKIKNDYIAGTEVPNWKNDGAFCKTAGGNLRILNTIFRTADSQGSGSYGLSLSDQRAFYKGSEIAKYSDVFSSGPLLIDNYNRLGESFIPSLYQSYSESALQSAFPDSEHPYHHQGSTHPRTAVALTGNNHLLMIVADGRFSKAEGFSAPTLTSFIADNFDPCYALNMDGGGSATLCVAGQGDPDTHVVNHPCDPVDGKRYYNHGNERAVYSHFYVVPRQ